MLGWTNSSTETHRKLPTATCKSVMKQEAGLSDVEILAGKWIQENWSKFAGEASKT